jgi:hypothetical protein
MNNEQQELLDEAYKNYLQHYSDEYNEEQKKLQKNPLHWMEMEYTNIRPYPKEEFIRKCKTDKEFSEKWGLTIEERDLSLLERREIAKIKLNRKEWTDVLFLAFRQSHSRTLVTISTLHAHYKETYDKYNIPTRIITLSYNNKTATSYE